MKRGFNSHPSFWFRFSLEQISRHIEAVETLLEKEAEDLVIKVDQQAKELKSEEARGEYFEFMGDDIWELQDLFPQMQRQASLMAAISVAEVELNKLCDYVAKKKSQRIKVADLKGTGLFRAKTFLSRIVCIKESWEGSAWQEVRRATEIRNSFVHNEGSVERKDIVDYVSKSPHLSKSSTSKIMLEKTYAPFVLGQIKSLYESVVNEMEKAL